MASNSIVDADAHYLEGIPKMAEYLDVDDPWKDRFAFTGHSTVSMFPNSTGDRQLYGRITRAENNYPEAPNEPEEIPATMEFLGIDKIVLISHKVLTFGRLHADDERANKFANAYVDYMLDEVVDPAEDIYTLIPVPYQDVEASVDVIDRVGDADAMVGITMITAGAEPPLGNRKYEPIYEAAADNDLAVVFHTGGAGMDEFHQAGYEKFTETHVLGFLMNNASQLTSVVIQGIPEKFPDLDIAFLESGIFYVPMMMNRLDAEYMKRPSESPYLERKPSEYIRDMYFGTQPLELPDDLQHLEWAIEMMGGADSLMYASDYPHWDYDPPKVVEDLPFLSDDEKAQILGGNAEEVYGI